MKLFDTETSAYLARRAGTRHRFLVYIWAARRQGGAIEGLGLWNGEDDRSFTIEGQQRLYLRLPVALSIDEIIAQPGTDVVFTQARFMGLPQAIRAALAPYDLRFAPVEFHRALFWPDTGLLVAPPQRLFKGWIDRMSDPRAEDGGQPEVSLTIASANRALTRTLPFKKSDPAQAAGRGNDRFRRYGDVGTVTIAWGESRVTT
jgi:hypothetical protein